MAQKQHDYIPRNDAEFDNWFRNLLDYVVWRTGGTPPEWDHIPQRNVDELAAAYEDWHDKYAPTLHPHTPAQTTAKYDARRRAEGVIRPFVKRFLHFDPVTNADRVNMALPIHDDIHTNHEVVEEEVEFNLIIRGIRVIHVDFWILGATGKAKPHNYDGAVIVWDVLDAPPSHPSALRRHIMASRTPFTLEFPEVERGKTVYVALCWQNGRGITGRWSDVKIAIVP
jgi:hypothetical protein